MAAGNFTYNDSYLPEKSIYYQVEVVSPDICYVTDLKSASDYNTSRSNIASNIPNSEENVTIYSIEGKVTIFPNPVFDKATINFPNPDHQLYTFSVFDITGKKVYSQVITDEKIEFEKSTLSEGLLIFEIKGGRTFKGKMIIIK